MAARNGSNGAVAGEAYYPSPPAQGGDAARRAMQVWMPVRPYGLERHRPTGWGVAAGGDKRIVLSLPAEECGGGGEASERLCLLIGFGCCVGDRRVEWRPAVRAFPVRLGRMSFAVRSPMFVQNAEWTAQD